MLVSFASGFGRMPRGTPARPGTSATSSTILRQARDADVRRERILISPSYNFAMGCWGLGGLQIFGFHNYILALPLIALAVLLSVQSGRVRFAFDKECLEVLTKQNNEQLGSSGENFAVGGANRWAYSTFLKYGFLPSSSLPLFMYFRENQTPNSPSEGQFHLFPMIMSPKELGERMCEYVGSDKQTS